MKKAQHYNRSLFPSKDNELLVGGIKLTQLQQRIGQTPFYAYDRQLITDRMAELRQQMPSDLKIHYAIKANPMPALVQHMATLVDGFDLASANEMKTALNTPMQAQNISFAGPGKRQEDIKQTIAAGVTLHVESVNELESIAKIEQEIAIPAHIAIRINPAFELKTSGMKMGGGAKPFGIDEEQLPSLLKRVKTLNLNFKGFHIYSGSQNLKAESIIEAQQQSFDLANKLSNHCSCPIEKLNIGGGFGIPYFPSEKPLNTKKVGDALNEMMDKFKVNHPQTEIIIELGRYLVGEAGVYVSQIIDKKMSRNKTFLVVNGGLHHHLAASGNFGQVIRKNYPIALGNKIQSSETEPVTIVGPLCTPLDVLGDKIFLPKAEIDDFVVVYQSGAYGYSASPHQFLSQAECIEALI
mgnify:CR=1 FL=1